MKFPFSIFDVGIWLAANTIILLATSEFLSSHYGRDICVDKRSFQVTSTIFGILFGIYVVYLIYVTW